MENYDKINEVFKSSVLYGRFHDSLGNQLKIGDYVRINKFLHNKYIHQGIYQIGFNFSDGIFFSLVGLYKTEYTEKVEIPRNVNLETEINQWTMHTKLKDFLVYDEDQKYHWRFEYEKAELKLVDFRSEFTKVLFIWHKQQEWLSLLDKDMAFKNHNEELTYEEVEKFLIDNVDRLTF